jgi:flavodoxin
MDALVVYESVYGNTRAIAEAIAEGLGGARTTAVHAADGAEVAQAELLVVGGPTHMHSLATQMSRKVALQAALEDGREHHAEPNAAAEPGLRVWLRDLPERRGARAAAFDTRLDRSTAMTGSACRGIARRLRHRGYEIAGFGSFLVADNEGPLEDGELDRARDWGRELARPLAGASTTATTSAG